VIVDCSGDYSLSNFEDKISKGGESVTSRNFMTKYIIIINS
jgi:hypothetical protein